MMTFADAHPRAIWECTPRDSLLQGRIPHFIRIDILETHRRARKRITWSNGTTCRAGAHNSSLAYDVDGDSREDVDRGDLFARSPTAGPRRRRAERGLVHQIARRVSFVRLLQTHRRTGSLNPIIPWWRTPRRAGPDDFERLKALARQQPDATLEELGQRLGVTCNLIAIWLARGKQRLVRARRRS